MEYLPYNYGYGVGGGGHSDWTNFLQDYLRTHYHARKGSKHARGKHFGKVVKQAGAAWRKMHGIKAKPKKKSHKKKGGIRKEKGSGYVGGRYLSRRPYRHLGRYLY